MRLKYQLFLALLAGGAVLIALLAGIADRSFNRGFLDYVNRVERQRFEPLRAALVDGYEARGDWDWIDTGPDAWRALVRKHAREDGHRARRPPPDRAERPDRAPPPDRTPILADAGRRVLAGTRKGGPGGPGGLAWTPLTLDGRTVGYLGDRPFKRVPPGLEELFALRQRRSVLIASFALLPVSALMAWLLTTRIVRPLDRLNLAVARIGDGDFAMRLPEERRDELGDLARRVNRLAATLESNLGARRRWLAEISHELRTPVAVLQAELEAMQDGVNPVDEAALESLHGETARLSRLIDDLRDLTLADAGALDYRIERIDLGALVAERLEQAGPRLAEAGIATHLERTGPLPVDADDQRIAQLIDNLLQNSLRYTDADGRLEVRLERGDPRVRLRWEDSAPGVPAAACPHLFDPLYRVDDSRRRETGGSGLGLAIVAKIAEAHGGRVRAEPSAFGGLAIELELPLATAPLDAGSTA